jgi:hypothetical protein
VLFAAEVISSPSVLTCPTVVGLTVTVRVTTVPEVTDVTVSALEVTVRVVVVGVAAEATVPASRMVWRAHGGRPNSSIRYEPNVARHGSMFGR